MLSEISEFSKRAKNGRFESNEKITIKDRLFLTHLIKKNIEEIDDKIWREHDTSTHYVKDIKSVRVNVGGINLSIDRRYYQSRSDGHFSFKLDELLELDNLKGAMPITNALDLIIKRSYSEASRQALDYIAAPQISKQLSDLCFGRKIKRVSEQVEVLYLALDGLWFSTWQKRGRSKELKFGVAFTGTKKVNGKSVLVDRVIINIQNIKDPLETAWRVENILNESYGEIKKLVIIGDGAKWITTLADNLSYETTRLIDKYHYHDYIKRFIADGPANIKLPQDLKTSMRSSDYKSFAAKLLDAIIDKALDANGELTLSKKQHDLFKLIRKFFGSYQENCALENAINPIEGIQSNFFAKFLRGRRAFKMANLLKLVELQCCFLNGWEIFKTSSNWDWMQNNQAEYSFFRDFSPASQVIHGRPCELGFELRRAKTSEHEY